MQLQAVDHKEEVRNNNAMHGRPSFLKVLAVVEGKDS